MHTLPARPRCILTSLLIATVLSTSAFAQTNDQPASPAKSKTGETDETPVVLPQFSVTAGAGTGYIGTNSLSATSAAIPVVDLPFSITVMTRQVLDDTAAHQLMNLNTFVSGMATYDRPYDDTESMTLRGFNATVSMDGMQTLGEVTRDLGIVERVEVLKGPSAILFPQGGSPGGMINVITKAPMERQAGYIKVQAGRYNANRAELDFNGTPAFNGKLLYRVVLVRHDADAFTDNEYTKRTIFFPAITYKFSDDSKVTVRYEKLKQTSTSPTGQGLGLHGEDDPAHPYFDFSLPRGRTTDDPNYNKYEKDDERFWAQFESKVSDAFAINLALQMDDTDDLRAGTRPLIVSGQPLIAADGTVKRRFFAPHWHQRDLLAAVDTATAFNFLGTKHTLIAGGSHKVYRQDKKDPGALLFPDGNVFAEPVPVAVGAFSLPDAQWFDDSRSYLTTVYATDVIKAWNDRITINFGFTGNWWEGQSFSKSSLRWSFRSLMQTAKQYGILVQPVPNFYVYASHNENFSPQNSIIGIEHSDGTVTQGERAPPAFNTSEEFGIKLRLLDGRLSFNAAAYDIELTNRTESILNTSWVRLLTSGTSKGFEADVTYTFNENVSVIATVAKINAKDNDGFRFTDIPTRTASGWIRYDFRKGGLKGMGVTGGFTYCDSMENTNNGVRFTYDGRLLVSAGLYYDLKPWKFQLNVTNLTDKDYFAGGSPPSITYRGEPRNIMGSVAYSF